MLDRFLSIVGACGLIIVLTGIVPMVPAYAASFGSGCAGTGCAEDTDTGACKADDIQPAGACTGTGCGCRTASGDCWCKT